MSAFTAASAWATAPSSGSSGGTEESETGPVLLTAAAVLLRVRLGVADHLLDVVLAQGGLAGDRHRLLLARGLVLGSHMHDAVGVDVEGDLDLGHAARGGRQVDELELAERLVERRHLPLALQHVDLHRGLHVLGSREDLAATGGDRKSTRLNSSH